MTSVDAAPGQHRTWQDTYSIRDEHDRTADETRLPVSSVVALVRLSPYPAAADKSCRAGVPRSAAGKSARRLNRMSEDRIR